MGQISDEIIRKLKANGNTVTNQIINDLIKSHSSEASRMKKLWDEYSGKTPILNRRIDNPLKSNQKISSNFRQTIVQQAVSWLFGNPVTYTIAKENYLEEDYQKIRNKIRQFNQVNGIADLDSTTGEYSSVCGYGSRLLYFDVNGVLRIMNILPWESLFVYNSTIDEIEYGMVYYPIEFMIDNKFELRNKVEFYDKDTVSYFFETSKDFYIPDPNEPEPVKLHGFNHVPLIKFLNSNNGRGDFEDVSQIIDNYDILVSDVQNELIEFRMAYLVFKGALPTQETIIQAKQTGAFGIQDANGDVAFITKDINAQVIDSQKKTLREDLFNSSLSIDPNDPALSGNAESGVARRLKFQNLEARCVRKERKFVKGLQKQFELLAFVWNKINVPLKAEDVRFEFGRTYSDDYEYYAGVSNKLYGQISDKTRLSLLPFVGDPDEEMNQMKLEAEKKGILINLEQALFNETTGSNE